MEEIQLSIFQKDVYSVIDAVIHSRQPVFISDKGKFLVKIIPVSYPEPKSWLGCMKGTGRITENIVSPAENTDNWRVLSE